MFFKKKKKQKFFIPYFVRVDYTPFAKKMCVQGEINMRIYHIRNNILEKTDFFSMARIRSLQSNGVPIIFMADPSQIPQECQNPADAVIPLGIM